MNSNGLSGVRYSIENDTTTGLETSHTIQDTITISGQTIPKLQLNSTREADSNNMLASRSTRRQNLTSHLSLTSQSTMSKMLGEMARTLGVCYLTNDIGWLLDRKRYQKTEKSTQRYLNDDKSEQPSQYLSKLLGKGFSIADAKKTKTQRRVIFNRDIRRATDDPKLLLRDSLAKFNGSYEWTKKEGMIQIQGRDTMIYDFIKQVSPKLFKQIKITGFNYSKDKSSGLFSDEKFMARMIQWLKRKEIEPTDFSNLVRFLNQAFQNGCSMPDYSEIVRLVRNRLFENEFRYSDAKKYFYSMLSQIMKDQSNFGYKLAVIIDYDPLIQSIKAFMKNTDHSTVNPGRELESIVNMVYEIILHPRLLEYTSQFKLPLYLLNKLSEVMLCPKKEQNNNSGYIMTVWLGHICIIDDIKDVTLFKKLCKVIKVLLYFNTDRKLKAAYFRAIYLIFLRLYSSLSKYYKPNHLLVISKLLNLLKSISIDKRNSEVAIIIRQTNVIHFLGKEFDLEYQIYNTPLRDNRTIQSINEIDDFQKTPSKSQSIPKLNLKLCFGKKSRKNAEAPVIDLKAETSVPKLNLKLLIESGSTPEGPNDGQSTLCNERYNISTQWRKIYLSPAIHKECLKLVLSILLADNCNSLEEEFTGQYPIQSGKLHYLFYFQNHLSHACNKELLNSMLERLKPKIEKKLKSNSFVLEKYEKEFLEFAEKQKGAKYVDTDESIISVLAAIARVNSGIYRLLQLLGHKDPNINIGKKIGEGGYSVVYSLNKDKAQAVKVIQPDTSIHDRNALFYLFNEISSLEYLSQKSDMHLQLYDYGLNLDIGYYLIFPLLTKNLDTNNNLMGTLSIFEDICREVVNLHDKRVVHYDIKRDNVMLHNSRAILVDYGEALQNEPSLRLRGTEVIRAPEMLLSGLECYEFDRIQGPSKYKETMALYKRHTKYNVGSACDVWGLGCLLYELYTGEFLFHSKDWSTYFYMVTNDSSIIVNEHVERKLDNNFFLIRLLKYIMVRNAQQRPSSKNVLRKVKAVRRLLSGDCSMAGWINSLKKLDTK